MKKMLVVTALAGAIGMAGPAFAKDITVKGELIDTSCYMGHGAKGAGHKKCAMTCIKGGAPMGVLTDKGDVYILLPNHDNDEPFNAAKELAAEIVVVTGENVSKGGVNAILVSKVTKAGK